MVRSMRTKSLQTSSRIGSRSEVTNAEEGCQADQKASDWFVAPAFGADCKGEKLAAVSDDEVRP
jgi:hypothetical protein